MSGTSSKPWKAIAAMAENRVIGDAGKIPWHLPEDFKWVKQCTRGQAIAMGRKTFESLGRPLPGRDNIVISRAQAAIDGCTVLPSLDALRDYTTDREIWIFGGAVIYRQALPRISDLYLTVVFGNFPGDTFFPAFEEYFTDPEVIREDPAFEIRHYRARS